ncbi:unnamed protein product [Linum trigynum]|uniref:Uncharacterized protein n=1 Tax=Linum trigynum TaxID=586398 RepID=A0AAV2CMW4_9ROSI
MRSRNRFEWMTSKGSLTCPSLHLLSYSMGTHDRLPNMANYVGNDRAAVTLSSAARPVHIVRSLDLIAD